MIKKNYDYGYIPGKNSNLEFNEYNLDPEQFKFLAPFQENWEKIRDEYQAFLASKAVDFELIQSIMKPKSNTITAKKASKDIYTVVGLLFNGLSLIDFIKKYNISWPSVSQQQGIDLLDDIYSRFFKQTQAVIQEAIQASGQRVRTVYYGTYKPGLDLKLHTNNNPHTYRAYLGLVVPKGNIAIKVCGKHYQFVEGGFLVLDHAYPHCPHNFTDHPRTALIIDFLKPDKPFKEMIALEEKVVSQRMHDNVYSYGVFGKDDIASREDFIKYGLENQLEWKDDTGFTG